MKLRRWLTGFAVVAVAGTGLAAPATAQTSTPATMVQEAVSRMRALPGEVSANG